MESRSHTPAELMGETVMDLLDLRTRLRVRGELTLNNYQAFRDAYVSAACMQPQHFDIDLSGVTRFDYSLIGMFLTLKEYMAGTSISLRTSDANLLQLFVRFRMADRGFDVVTGEIEQV